MDKKIVITGAAGLVGQNLVLELKKNGFTNIICLDKHSSNTPVLKKLNPEIEVIQSNLAKSTDWDHCLEGCNTLILLHAQIGSLSDDEFIENNITATERVIEQAKKYNVPYIIHASSSVVESVANDDYTNTKKEQEQLVIDCGIKYCILRPTLMFGWFDRKHLGWLARFMQKIPIFPIPGMGKFMRQPLYVRDFCKIIVSCVKNEKDNKIYNITGREQIYYADLIKLIRAATNAKMLIVHIPYWLFWTLLKIYSFFDKDPPFTTSQLKALTAGDEFELIEWWNIFNVESTPLKQAIYETFTDPVYSKITLDF